MELIFNSPIFNVGDSSDIRLKVWYEHRRNSNNMEYRFKWQMYLSYKDSETPNPYAWYSDNRRLILYLNNNNVYENNSQSSSSGWDTGEITTNWFTVKNKTTGTTPFYFYALDTSNTSWLNYRSNPIQLEIDPAGSTLGSVSGFNIGDAISIPIYVYNSAYSNQLTVKIGNTTICTRDTQITESGTYTLEFTSQELSSIYALIDSTLQKEFTFLLKTYDGQTQIGDGYSTKATGNLTESSPVLDSTPTVTITAPVQTPSNTVIKGVSTVSFGISAHSRKKATIVSCKVNKQDLTLVSETTVGDEHYVIYNGSLTGDTDKYYYEIVDSRGQKYNGVYTAYVIDYIPVTFSGTLSRLSSTSSTIKIEYSGNFWAGNFGNGSSGYQNNSLTIDWSYKLASSDIWTTGGTLSPTIDTTNNKYSGNTNLTGTFDYDKDYDFKIEYYDLINAMPVRKGVFIQRVIKGLGVLELYKTTALVNGDIDVTGQYLLNGEPFSGGGESLPLGTIVKFDGNTVPEGYERVDELPTYSTQETICGTWIDGRPIYRKCFEILNVVAKSEQSISQSNIDFIIDLKGSLQTASENYPVQYNNLLDSNHNQVFIVKANNKSSNTINYYAGTTGTARIIIDYVKTTN